VLALKRERRKTELEPAEPDEMCIKALRMGKRNPETAARIPTSINPTPDRAHMNIEEIVKHN